jgi:hypothetical protein
MINYIQIEGRKLHSFTATDPVGAILDPVLRPAFINVLTSMHTRQYVPVSLSPCASSPVFVRNLIPSTRTAGLSEIDTCQSAARTV